VFLTALHIGCGSSTVGEYLLQRLGFHEVVNVDRDEEIMKQMEVRWKNIVAKTGGRDVLMKRKTMEFITMDFTVEHLPDQYTNRFDLVLDKSTLDCTLCSDTATASLLIEVYRTLKKDGGVYIVISFHELDLLLPLLRDLPGTKWTVEHTTMDRQVERIVTTTNQTYDDDNNDNNNLHESFPSPNQRPLNVLIARCTTNQENDEREEDDSCRHTLVFEDVCQHVHAVNDRWFQEQHPLLTEERTKDLQHAFGMSQQPGCDEDGADSSKILSLQEAFYVLFTPTEREHLTFEHFLEDWEAFLEANSNSVTSSTTITYTAAVQFLQQTQ
jgi:SAM-dependent methyltransferase